MVRNMFGLSLDGIPITGTNIQTTISTVLLTNWKKH